MYFSSEEIKELLKSTYRDLFKYPIVKSIRKTNKDTSDRVLIQDEFEKELKCTRFLGVGNPSESGAHLLYYFRQENFLSKKLFLNAHEIFDLKDSDKLNLSDPSITKYVFIDDFCGGGTQAKDYLSNVIARIKSISPETEIHYYVLFGNESGLKHVKDNTLVDRCDAVFKLDETYKCFGDRSRYIPENLNELDWGFAETMSKKYGDILYPDHPLGHGGCQFLIGFFHNTPNNTLPVIWKHSDDWQPIFKRYDKIYGGGI